MQAGYTQHADVTLDAQGNGAAATWLGSIHGNSDQAANGISDARTTVESSGSGVEDTCQVQPNCTFFVFSPDGVHIFLYSVWSEENVFGEVAMSIPSTSDEGIIKEEATTFVELIYAAGSVIDRAVTEADQPSATPTPSPTFTATPTSTPTPTATATPTSTPTATSTPTPTATPKPVKHHLKACKKGSHRVHGKCQKKP
jgi:hypothetical protein